MPSKDQILSSFRPHAALLPLTNQAKLALPQGRIVGDVLPILRLPFRIGRESRVQQVNGEWHRIERPRRFGHGAADPTNELYLIDSSELLQVSREHCLVDRAPGGGWRVVDRRSVCGTGVGDRHIGGKESGGEAPLVDGDTITVGVANVSVYRYQFIAFD